MGSLIDRDAYRAKMLEAMEDGYLDADTVETMINILDCELEVTVPVASTQRRTTTEHLDTIVIKPNKLIDIIGKVIMSTKYYGIDDYGFVIDDALLETIAANAIDDYDCERWREDMWEYIEELQQRIYLEHISEFTGDVCNIDENGLEAWLDSENYDDNTLFYIPLKRTTSLFYIAYHSMGDIIEEVEREIGKYLPEGFDISEHICHIIGTYYG